MVPRRGLEPPRLAALVPETSASTNSAIWADGRRCLVAVGRGVNEGRKGTFSDRVRRTGRFPYAAPNDIRTSAGRHSVSRRLSRIRPSHRLQQRAHTGRSGQRGYCGCCVRAYPRNYPQLGRNVVRRQEIRRLGPDADRPRQRRQRHAAGDHRTYSRRRDRRRAQLPPAFVFVRRQFRQHGQAADGSGRHAGDSGLDDLLRRARLERIQRLQQGVAASGVRQTQRPFPARRSYTFARRT